MFQTAIHFHPCHRLSSFLPNPAICRVFFYKIKPSLPGYIISICGRWLANTGKETSSVGTEQYHELGTGDIRRWRRTASLDRYVWRHTLVPNSITGEVRGTSSVGCWGEVQRSGYTEDAGEHLTKRRKHLFRNALKTRKKIVTKSQYTNSIIHVFKLRKLSFLSC